ncbi:hypothetical protein K505DRAFT_30056 [Melanomma pulvis-pyrius CBS 109.77]|uniref:Uncharacterized protein n=1 Tax=Melanomma pulvis-pyrius CBS 109.77 TaxID=1314802 RepID=A0A6A6XCL8_9PLEO|nr:hypothetical protein K505DRAFT_30056 [Melanomma pulvis-pyrius CBS 109.77]
MTLDYFPSSSITPDHESVLPPDALGVSVITTTASQTRSKTPSLIFDNTCSEADAPPPEYTSYDGRVSGGMRYPGLDDPGMSSSSQQYGSLAYSPNPSQEYVSDGTQVASDAKGPKRQIILSHTKSLALRGTNNHGPVNPLELFPDLNAEKKSQDTHATSKNNERYDIIQSVPVELPSDLPVELPSDLPVELPTVPLEKQLTELPAELPTNDSGPDPGYSRSIMRKPVPDLKPKSVQSQHEAPIPHRQAKIAPRPTSRTWQSNPTPQANPVSPTIHAPAFHYEMADPSSSVSLLSSARSTSISSVSSVPSPISSPVSSSFLTQKPSIQYGLHGSSSSVSLLSSPWSTSANSVPTGPSPISSPWQTSRNRPSVKPQTLSSPRMRNQKSYLDLLGIIDKS